MICVMEECPRSSCTIFGCLPLLNSSIAKVWPRMWKRYFVV